MQRDLHKPYLEAEDAVEGGQVDVLVLIERGVLLSVHQAAGVPLCCLREVGVRAEDVRVDVVSDHVLRKNPIKDECPAEDQRGKGTQVQKGHVQWFAADTKR